MTERDREIVRDFDPDLGVLTVTINRPDKLNSLNLDTLLALDACLETAVRDADVRGLIVTGSGTRAFIAGADIAEFKQLAPADAEAFSLRGQRVLARLETSAKPVIAAVNGFALGGGCEVAMACHVRIASENARFGQPEVNLGISPGYGGTQRLVQLVGKGKAMELMLTGDHIGAAEALRIGLVNQVVPASELLPTCRAMMQRILTKAPVAVAKVIEAVNAYFAATPFDAEARAFADCCSTEDFQEGTSAFIEKRTPRFTGR